MSNVENITSCLSKILNREVKEEDIIIEKPWNEMKNERFRRCHINVFLDCFGYSRRPKPTVKNYSVGVFEFPKYIAIRFGYTAKVLAEFNNGEYYAVLMSSSRESNSFKWWGVSEEILNSEPEITAFWIRM